MHKIILVVGTTSDYIQWIRTSCPGRALFITSPVVRQTAEEACPAPCEEIVMDLSDRAPVFEALEKHLKTWNKVIDGIFSFDCEAMALTAAIAENWDLDYPSEQAILNCRDKYVSKRIWESHGIKCPKVSPIKTVSDVLAFFHSVQNGCVLKPLTGSGSELVLKCMNESDCHRAFDLIQKGLEIRAQNPLFETSVSRGYLMLAEELIPGTEYSCDFICENDEIRIIRMARKIKSPFKPFGTITGYVLPGQLPPGINPNGLSRILLRSAQVLGIDRGLCMVDFIISGEKIELIELTPRPGGDCLPYLLKVSTTMDILKLSLDFAQKYPLDLIRYDTASPHVGIRLHADKSGILKQIHISHLLEDTRVKHILLTKKPGHLITMPPKDYDSWLLGHVIIEPSNGKYPETQAMSISKTITILIDPGKQITHLPEAS
ncbi:MAG: ATP-grasp domain-containing protein [Desulfobacterium sp.]|nr:ATP-grasp domain-containing protein [Desulfobacterium sp.]